MRRWLGLRELYIQPVSDLAVEQRANGGHRWLLWRITTGKDI